MTTEKPKTPRKAPAKPRAAKVKDKLAPMIAEAPSAEEAEVFIMLRTLLTMVMTGIQYPEASDMASKKYLVHALSCSMSLVL